MARLIPNAAQVAAFERAALDDALRRDRQHVVPQDPSVERGLNPWDDRVGGSRYRSTGRPPGRPRVAGSLRDLVAGLGAVGDWFETAAPSARVNSYGAATALGVRVSCVQAQGGDAYRVTRIADDAPHGRWPTKNAKNDQPGAET